MNIDNSQTRVSFSFTPATHYLVYGPDSRFPNATSGGGEPIMTWSLNHRIDMSYKGKDDQLGMEVIYLTDQEAEACKKAGFIYMEM